MRSVLRLGALMVVLGLVAAACTTDTEDDQQQDGGGVLDRVRSRGTLNCGVNDAVPGFGFVDAQGNFSGFDVDYCRAVAAAVLGAADAVEFTPLTAEQRFTALQSGEIDVLIRNTTWTAERDGSEGAAFTTTTFYDGQGMMVPADSDVRRLEDLDGNTICVLSGTTTERNLESQFNALGINYRPRTYEDNESLQSAFISGVCQGWTSDKSQLASLRVAFPESEGGPEALRILDETMSKEPLGPVVRDGDSDWFDVVNWVVIATIQAEEFGITSGNVDQIASTAEDPNIREFLGLEVETDAGAEVFDPGLNLPTDFAVQVINAVGNYEEIYERNITPVGIPRGLNSLFLDGGLLYAPPY